MFKRRLFSSRILSLFLIFSFSSTIFAQEFGGEVSDVGGGRVTSVSTFIKGKYIPKESPFNKLNQKIYMDFQDVGLNEVLKLFSQQSGLNFIAAEEVKERNLTMYLSGVTVEEALNAIMKANNLNYEAVSNEVFIVKESRRPLVDTVTRVFTIKYAQLVKYNAEGAEEETTSGIKAVLEGLLTEYGKIAIDSRTNSLIVTEIPDQMPLIEEMIQALDTKTQQVLIEVQMIEMNPSTARRLGFDWSETPFTFTGPAVSTKMPFNRSRDLEAYGDKSTGVAYGTLTMTQFQIVQHLIEDVSEVNYLATPKVLTVNNQEAEVTISASQAVGVESVTVSDTGQIIETAERLDIGVTLKVTPQINKDNFITMAIEPTVSRAIQSPYFAQFVDQHTRSTKTNVMIKSGDTIVISGLMQEETEDSSSGVPFLGNIPVLGYLFSYKQKSSVKTELIVFLTPHVIGVPGTFLRSRKEQDEPAVVPPSGKEADVISTVEEKWLPIKREGLTIGVEEKGLALEDEEKDLPTEAELRKGIVYPTLRVQEGLSPITNHGILR